MQLWNAPGLGSRLILRHHAARGEIQRKFMIGFLGMRRDTPLDESARARRCSEAIQK